MIAFLQGLLKERTLLLAKANRFNTAKVEELEKEVIHLTRLLRIARDCPIHPADSSTTSSDSRG